MKLSAGEAGPLIGVDVVLVATGERVLGFTGEVPRPSSMRQYLRGPKRIRFARPVSFPAGPLYGAPGLSQAVPPRLPPAPSPSAP